MSDRVEKSGISREVQEVFDGISRITTEIQKGTYRSNIRSILNPTLTQWEEAIAWAKKEGIHLLHIVEPRDPEQDEKII